MELKGFGTELFNSTSLQDTYRQNRGFPNDEETKDSDTNRAILQSSQKVQHVKFVDVPVQPQEIFLRFTGLEPIPQGWKLR